MSAHRHTTFCPHCDREQGFWASEKTPDETPIEGSLGICVDCGHWSTYRRIEGQLQLVRLEPKEIETFSEDVRAEMARHDRTWARLHSKRRA